MLCPFNTETYAGALTNIGTPEIHPGRRLFVLRRPIGQTALFDGVGPWPYLWIDGRGDIDALHEGYRHLVTLAVVTQPGHVPQVPGDGATLLKQHFVYDPSLPPPALSTRTRLRLRQSEAVGAFEAVNDRASRLAMVDIYDGLKRRRRLEGGFFDYPRRHFEIIADLPGSVFFRTANAAGTGAMACGVLYGDMLQILHTAISADGLRWNASYLLMYGLQAFARDRGVRLLTGGMPDSGSDGLRIFKQRWANSFAPVYLLRIVNDPERYRALSAPRATPTPYFPAYRAPR